jgi:hypothetical protein
MFVEIEKELPMLEGDGVRRNQQYLSLHRCPKG